MLSKKELLLSPNYLLEQYQNEIYRQLISFMEANNLTQKEVAEKLGVSGSYISQVLNGNFNFTLKKLIELGLMINKVPYLQFLGFNEYWSMEKEVNLISLTISVNPTLNFDLDPNLTANYTSLPEKEKTFTQEISGNAQDFSFSDLECCLN